VNHQEKEKLFHPETNPIQAGQQAMSGRPEASIADHPTKGKVLQRINPIREDQLVMIVRQEALATNHQEKENFQERVQSPVKDPEKRNLETDQHLIMGSKSAKAILKTGPTVNQITIR
jgi:hypothetical protein